MSQTKAELINAKGNAAFDTDTLYIDATNNRVGLGTSTPQDILHLSNAGNLYLRITNSSTGINAYLGQDSNGTYIGNTGAADVRFIQGASERMRLTSTGLGVGSTTPGELLSLYKDNNPYISFQNSATGTTSSDGGYVGMAGTEMQIRNKENAALSLWTDNTERARIDSSGRLLVGTSSAIDTPSTTRLQVQGDAYISGLTYAPGKNYAETSNTGSTSIVNTGITLTGGALYEVAVCGNPAPGGSGSYKNIIFGYISVMVDFNFGSSSVQATIYYDQTFAKNGSVGSFTVSAVFWNGSTENTSVLQSNWAANQIRVKVAGSGGSAQEVRLRRIF